MQTESSVCNLYPHDQLQMILREQPLTHSLSYDHLQGYLPLRQAVVKYMKEYLKVEATEQSIMITSGAQQALHAYRTMFIKSR